MTRISFALKTRPIATRNGKPAYLDAPAPRKAVVSMKEWMERNHEREIEA